MGYEMGDFLADSYERALVEVHEIASNEDLSVDERLAMIRELTARYGKPDEDDDPQSGDADETEKP
ncbi:hypothetical protein ACWDSF_06210 [Nocardia beijingensis]